MGFCIVKPVNSSGMDALDWCDQKICVSIRSPYLVWTRSQVLSNPRKTLAQTLTGTLRLKTNSFDTRCNIMSEILQYYAHLLLKEAVERNSHSFQTQAVQYQEATGQEDTASRFTHTVDTPTAAGKAQLRDSSRKKPGTSEITRNIRCEVDGCVKFARDASARRCIRHGGGRRCSVAGCAKSARSSADYCIAHGGGKRCVTEGCKKSSVGPLQLCIAHGGGSRCQHQGCKKASQGKTGFCIAHGGGRRCQSPDCTLSTQGANNFCKNHMGDATFRGTGLSTKAPEDGYREGHGVVAPNKEERDERSELSHLTKSLISGTAINADTRHVSAFKRPCGHGRVSLYSFSQHNHTQLQ